MYYEEKEIKELFFLKHRHDSEGDFVDYQKILLDKSVSPYMYNNKRMSRFLQDLQRLATYLFDNVNIVRNFKDYVVDKYYYKHIN